MPLYKRVFHTADPTLTFVGLMQSTGAARRSWRRSPLAAACFAGDYALPRESDVDKAIAKAHSDAVDRWGQKRPMMRIDFDHFIGDAAKELRNGASRVRRVCPRSARAPAPASPCRLTPESEEPS